MKIQLKERRLRLWDLVVQLGGGGFLEDWIGLAPMAGSVSFGASGIKRSLRVFWRATLLQLSSLSGK